MLRYLPNRYRYGEKYKRTTNETGLFRLRKPIIKGMRYNNWHEHYNEYHIKCDEKRPNP